MSQKAEFLQLEADDDVTSVRDRLGFMRGKKVLLVWPENGTVLTRKLDLVLIQREAVRQAIRLALVTHDPQVIKHAEELNLSAFETIGESERKRWKRGRTKVFTTRFQRPEDEPEAEELMPVASRLREDDEEAEQKSKLPRIIAVALMIAAVLAVAFVVVPGATVTITPAREPVVVSASLIADPQATDVDIQNATVPAVTLRVDIEDTGTIETTGTQQLSDTLAGGSVVFINQTEEAVEIPADTVVMTSAGTPVRFRTTETAITPAEVGGQIEVPIEAMPESAGTKGNVDANLINTIEGDLAASLTVRNITPTFGGESRTLRAVSQEDIERLETTLRQQLQARAYVGMEAQRTETQTIILETIRIAEEREDWKQWSAGVGDIADTLTLTMRARVEATVIDETLARQIAFALLNAQIPPGRELVPNTVTYTCCTLQAIDPTGRVSFAMDANGTLVSRVNTAMLQERLAGRTPDDARRYLLSEVHLADNTTPDVTLSPDWTGRLPLLPMRIQINVLDAPA